MTAKHAELKRFATLAPKSFHTSIALNGKTKRATMRDFRLSMPGAKHFATGQNHRWRRWRGAFDLRDRDFYISGFNHQFHITQPHSLSGLQHSPLHALTMGYLGCTLVAMITRVAAGHSGRPLAVDGLAWALYLLLQAAVLARVAAALWPAAATALTLAAIAAWAVACSTWALRYGGWMGRPRVDGRPG